MTLWNQEAPPDHRLHDQLEQAGWFWHDQFRHSKEIRIRPAYQKQLAWRDSGIGSSQPPPVHPEVAYELGRVVPVHGGVEVQTGGGGFWSGTGATQPNDVIDAQAPNRLWGGLQTGYI